MRETWRRVLLMRSFWLAVIVIAGVLLLVGLRVEGGKRSPAARKEKDAAAPVAARIDHCDLTGLLYLQGYRQSEFVERKDP